jgi:hypothetical protein
MPKRDKFQWLRTVLTVFLLLSVGKAQDYTASGPNYRAQEKTSSAAAQEAGKKPWAVSVSVREEYDDNINTEKRNKDSSFKTIVSPSFLINYPIDQTLLSARYTYGMTYYDDREGSNFDHSHEFNARINHSFSSRFNLDIRDRVLYTQEPELGNGTTFTRRNGSYFMNDFSAQANAQWTPKFGTATAYTNTYINYDSRLVDQFEKRVIHGVSNDFKYEIHPRVTLVAGIIYRYQDYLIVQRDSQSVTPNAGVDFRLSPEATLGARVGATYSDFIGGGESWSPYGSVNFDWQLGARSTITASYRHYVEGTDVANAFLQETDEFSFGGRYAITRRWSIKGRLSYALGSYDSGAVTGGQSAFDESTLAGDIGMGFALNQYLDLEVGYIYTRVDSDISNRGYDRNRAYIGIRGTY